MQAALVASYINLQEAIALMHILEDQHEHLGQSITYARSNGVVPPWSK